MKQIIFIYTWFMLVLKDDGWVFICRQSNYKGMTKLFEKAMLELVYFPHLFQNLANFLQHCSSFNHLPLPYTYNLYSFYHHVNLCSILLIGCLSRYDTLLNFTILFFSNLQACSSIFFVC
jgi:hypothetical protein